MPQKLHNMADGNARSIIDTRKRKGVGNSDIDNDRSPPKKKYRIQDLKKLRPPELLRFMDRGTFEAPEPPSWNRGMKNARFDERIQDNRLPIRERDDHLYHLTKVLDEGREQDREIRTLRAKLTDAEKVTDRQSDKLYEQEKQIKHMRQTVGKQQQQHSAELVELENRDDEQETAIQLASALLQQAHQDRDRQAQQLFERNALIETLNDRVYKMATLLPDEAAQVALESQAQRHLNVMRGLQTDLAKREAFIADLQADHAKALEAQEALTLQRISAETTALQKQHEEARRSIYVANKAAMAKRILAETALQKKHEANRKALIVANKTDTAKQISNNVKHANAKAQKAVQQAASAKHRTTTLQKQVEAANKRAKELQAATDDQKRLIEKLMETNKRLASQQT